jgi:hypothetical protein
MSTTKLLRQADIHRLTMLIIILLLVSGFFLQYESRGLMGGTAPLAAQAAVIPPEIPATAANNAPLIRRLIARSRFLPGAPTRFVAPSNSPVPGALGPTNDAAPKAPGTPTTPNLAANNPGPGGGPQIPTYDPAFSQGPVSGAGGGTIQQQAAGPSAVPEPDGWLLGLSGILLVAFLGWRNQRRRAWSQ